MRCARVSRGRRQSRFGLARVARSEQVFRIPSGAARAAAVRLPRIGPAARAPSMLTLPAEVTDLPRLVEPLLFASLRILTALLVAPLFPTTIFPGLLRNTVIVSLSLAVYPHAAANLPVGALDGVELLVLVGKEVLVGGLVGLSIAVLVHAFESVGALIDLQTGMSNALLYDPFGEHSDGPMSSLMVRLAVTFFVVGGGLYVLVSLLFESFRVWPIASFHPTIDVRLADFATAQLGALSRLVVRVATPVVLVLAIVDLCFGLINRVVPQLNVFFFTMPIKGILAAMMVALFLSYLAETVAAQVASMSPLVDRLAPALAPPAPRAP